MVWVTASAFWAEGSQLALRATSLLSLMMGLPAPPFRGVTEDLTLYRTKGSLLVKGLELSVARRVPDVVMGRPSSLNCQKVTLSPRRGAFPSVTGTSLSRKAASASFFRRSRARLASGSKAVTVTGTVWEPSAEVTSTKLAE